MGERYSGPYDIAKVHENRTITIQLVPNVTERIDIRQVIPYHKETT